jgi:hypothetical protein
MCLLASWIQRYQDSDGKLWKDIADFKYDTCSPNILCSKDRNASPFWKGVMWAAQAAKMGYRWNVGDGKRIRFWKDHWFGSCSLVVQFWDVYMIVNEQGCTLVEACDGSNLRFTFKRTVDRRVMDLWLELVQITESIRFSDEPDALIWKYNSSGRYSVQSLCGIVNDRGVKQIFTPLVWKLQVPPRIHIFLWLLSKNKILTRDNLVKRKKIDDLTCLFCSELESAKHFFECCVAHNIWGTISEMLGFQVGMDFESMAKLWLNDKKCRYVNIATDVVLWCLWKIRNNICF